MTQAKSSALLSQDTARAGLKFFMMAWTLTLFASFIIDGEASTWGRMLSSAALVAAGWTWYLLMEDSQLSPAGLRAGRRYGFGIAMGMTFGFLGDLCMAGIIPLPNSTMGGIGSFGIGHVFYIVALLGLGKALSLDRTAPKYGSILLWLAIGAIGWYVVSAGAEWTVVRIAALPYSLLLAGTVGCAMALAVQDKMFTPLVLGAAFFFVSDLLIALRMFHGNFPRSGLFIWILYGPGQMLIVYSTGVAIARLREKL
jgi:uncharacterized membrane protein YhhN